MIKHLYIHIPFCKKICPYCDFNKRVSSDNYMIKYRDKLKEEIKLYKDSYKDLETIYIGGGTPSFYPYLKDILDELNKYIDLKIIKEFTVESTIESLANLIDIIPNYNINRISIGIESFNEKTLEYLGRRFDINDLCENLNKIKEIGINNINFDLIAGLPFETIDSIKKGLDILISLNPTHISYYDLIKEEKTKLSYDLKMKKINLPKEDEVVEMLNLIDEVLGNNGYTKYEISNYKKEGFESIHNLAYWRLNDYLGLGSSAHSLVGFKRFYNTYDLKEYINGDLNKIEEDTNLKNEYFLMGLRMIKGVSISKYKSIYNKEMFIDFPFINKFIDLGLLRIDGDNLSFTDKGLRLSNIVFREFV